MASDPDSAAQPDEPLQPAVPRRVVLLSIAIFWLFYFVIVTLRGIALGLNPTPDVLAPRTLVTLSGMAITYLIYLALRVLAGISFRASVLGSVLLAVPGAIVYSTINMYAFRAVDERLMEEKARAVVLRTRDPQAGPMPSTTVIQIGEEPSHDKHKSIWASIADNAFNGYFILVAYAALYLALSYAAGARLAERRAARFRAAAQSAELRALRYQVNPHFLFNTLNSLSSLVMVDRQEEAERMILNLSTFFRTSLTADPAEDLPLAEEIRLQRLYLDIERVRFPERLRCEVTVPEQLNSACVPALILQPLIENAIKYGVSRSREPVTVRIAARQEGDRLLLEVADDGRPIEGVAGKGEPGTGVGLRNVRDRLAARFGTDATCRWGPIPGGGFRVALEMPVVRNGC